MELVSNSVILPRSSILHIFPLSVGVYSNELTVFSSESTMLFKLFNPPVFKSNSAVLAAPISMNKINKESLDKSREKPLDVALGFIEDVSSFPINSEFLNNSIEVADSVGSMASLVVIRE